MVLVFNSGNNRCDTSHEKGFLQEINFLQPIVEGILGALDFISDSVQNQ